MTTVECERIAGARTARNEAVRRGCDPTPDLAATSRKGDALASAQSTAPDPTSVYRYYDARGMLIYVGITRQGMGRNVQHNHKAEWWPHVARQDVEHHETRYAAAKREKELIRRYRPPFNRQHNLGHEELRAAYLNYQDRTVTSDDPLRLYRLLGKELPLSVSGRNDKELRLTSFPQHSALAQIIRITTDHVSLGPGKGRGKVLWVDTSGGYAQLFCRINDDSVVLSASAHVALKMELGKPYARLDKVTLTVGAA